MNLWHVLTLRTALVREGPDLLDEADPGLVGGRKRVDVEGGYTGLAEGGQALGHVLRIQAVTSRQRRSVRAEETAAKASVKMIGPLVLLFAAILILIVVPIAIKVAPEFSN